MLKWILRIGYAFLLILIAVFVYREADAERRLGYLIDKGMPHYYNNELDEYFGEFMVATSRNMYLEKPLYQAVANDEKTKFKISIFHTRAVTKQGSVDVLTIVLSDIDISVIPVNDDNYLKNSNLIRVRINLNFNKGHIYQDYSLKGESLALTSVASLDAAIPIEISIGEKDGEKLFGISEGTASKLESITVELIDNTDQSAEAAITYLAKLSSDATKTDKFNVIDELITGEANFPIYSEELDEEVTAEALVSTNFNGLPERYDAGSIYEETKPTEKIVYTNLNLLKPYNKVINKYFTIYGIVALIVTYLLFFLKPMLKHIKKQKALKTMSEQNNESTPIFKDR